MQAKCSKFEERWQQLILFQQNVFHQEATTAPEVSEWQQ